ncbi:MAG: VanZ family protein [Myxococcota bacterium]|jgi:hypothetical protein|nr:VanZ family protein [Myxococcota bacterium]
MPSIRLGSRRRAWLILMAWTAAIWFLGGDDFRHSETSRILGPLYEWLLPHLGPEQRAQWLSWTRLGAHPAVYALEAGLAWRAFGLSFPHWAPLRRAGLTLATAALLAGADEIRQTFSSVRTGSPIGVGLDMLGAGGVVVGLLAWARRPGAGARVGPNQT